ncbi:hypothetical protein OKW35_000498 [Paraburkholderia sp. MM5477-R1]
MATVNPPSVICVPVASGMKQSPVKTCPVSLATFPTHSRSSFQTYSFMGIIHELTNSWAFLS